VRAGREHLARASDNRNADVVIGIDGGGPGRQLRDHLLVECVADVGTVERDVVDDAVAVTLERAELIVHASIFSLLGSCSFSMFGSIVRVHCSEPNAEEKPNIERRTQNRTVKLNTNREQRTPKSEPPYIRKTPNFGDRTGALNEAKSARASVLRV